MSPKRIREFNRRMIEFQLMNISYDEYYPKFVNIMQTIKLPDICMTASQQTKWLYLCLKLSHRLHFANVKQYIYINVHSELELKMDKDKYMFFEPSSLDEEVLKLRIASGVVVDRSRAKMMLMLEDL